MIDVMFAAAKDVEAGVGADDADPEAGSASSIAPDAQLQKHTPTEILQSIRSRIVAAMASKLGSPLIAHKRALYRSADGTKRIACAVSKFYERSDYYWYAYHPGWEAFLADGTEAFFVLGCVDRDIAFALPHAVIKGALESLNTTAREDGKTYWHVILQLEKSGDLALVLPKKSSRVSLAEFKFDLPSE